MEVTVKLNRSFLFAINKVQVLFVNFCSDADIMRAKQEKAAQKKADPDEAQAGTSKGK